VPVIGQVTGRVIGRVIGPVTAAARRNRGAAGAGDRAGTADRGGAGRDNAFWAGQRRRDAARRQPRQRQQLFDADQRGGGGGYSGGGAAASAASAPGTAFGRQRDERWRRAPRGAVRRWSWRWRRR